MNLNVKNIGPDLFGASKKAVTAKIKSWQSSLKLCRSVRIEHMLDLTQYPAEYAIIPTNRDPEIDKKTKTTIDKLLRTHTNVHANYDPDDLNSIVDWKQFSDYEFLYDER